MVATPSQTDTYNTALDIFDKTHPLRVDADENLKVTGTFTPSGTQNVSIVGSVPIPVTQSGTWTVNLATEPTIDIGKVDQGTGGASPWLISGTVTANAGTGTFLVDGSAHTQPVSGPLTDAQLRATPVPISGTVTTTPTGTQNVSIVSTISLPVTGTFFQATQPVSGTGNFTVVQPTGTNLHTTVDNFPATQPVSGTVTANQGTSPWVVSGTVTANAGTGTFAISAASLPLPTGASTEATLSSLNSKVTVVNTGAVTISAPLPTGTNVIGHVITDSGSTVSVSNFPATQPVSGTVTVTQATGTNLHAVIDSGALTSITNPVTVIQPTGANLNVTVSNFPAGGSNVSVVGPVSVSNFPIFQPVQPVDATLLPINPAKEDGNLAIIAQEISRIRRLAEVTSINQVLQDLQLIVLNERYSSTNDYEVR